MFLQLAFLMLSLLVINFSLEWPAHSVIPLSPSEAFLAGIFLYVATIAGISWQNSVLLKEKKRLALLLSQTELIGFLVVFHFLLGVRIFHFSSFLTAFFSLFLYVAGLWFASRSLQGRNSKSQEIWLALPFALPFLVLTLLIDLLSLTPWSSLLDQTWGVLAFILVFSMVMILFLPVGIVKLWNCRPMPDSALKTRLEEICRQSGFKHGGFKIWTPMQHTVTAAILGVLPRLRYIMFTQRLLDELEPEAIEAILAHEIGHSVRRHLWIYPLIFLGMVIGSSIFIDGMFYAARGWIGALQALSPSAFEIVYPIAVLSLYILCFGLYFRYVFGFFSRLFERQADLHGFEVGIPGKNMIKALDDVAIATGFTHMAPNWHHYSIKERMDFLEMAIENPKRISQHHSYVRQCLQAYFVLLLLGICYIIIS
jgi:STE24 endopeptidase